MASTHTEIVNCAHIKCDAHLILRGTVKNRASLFYLLSAAEGGLVTTYTHPEAGSTHVLAPPYRFDGVRLPVRSGPPKLGEGTNDVLQSLLGLSDEQLSQLKAEGVV